MMIKLRVVQGKQRGKSLSFPEGEFIFGRGPECHVRPNSDLVSREHCLLRVSQEGVIVRDLHSTNGTLVNGLRVLEDRPLTDGDHLQVGPLVLQVVIEPASLPEDLPLESARKETRLFGQETQELLNFKAPDPQT